MRRAPAHDDPGLQPERTSLAWGRTLLSLVAASTLLLRWLPHHGWAAAAPLAAAAATALLLAARQRHRYRRGARGIAAGAAAPDALEIVGVGCAVVVLGALSLAAILWA